MYSYLCGETIAAIATPLGEGGIAIIRISGKEAVAVAGRLFSGPVHTFASHTVHFGSILDQTGKKIDEALLVLMRGPKSYTGEDTVELQCHGGMIASKKVLEAALHAGARAALPGEFTFKAFMNGKLDLTQAEAVQALIGAKNEQAFAIAGAQLEGALSKKIASFQAKLVSIAAILEAWVDFPEEGLEFASHEEIRQDLQEVYEQMHALVCTFEDGKRRTHGIKLCLVGAPNAGKSSLMNALLDEERAIVTSIAGTTRDLLHEELTLGGFSFRLTDTAGIRKAQGGIEQEGIRRTHQALSEADLILCVLDVTKKPLKLLETLPREKTAVVFNKSDLPHTPFDTGFPVQVRLSAKTREGIETLRQTLVDMVWKLGMPEKDEVVLTSARHKEALVQACQDCTNVIQGLQNGLSAELVTADMRSCLKAIGRIIGSDVTEEILTSIFSTFCIGK